MQLRYLQTLTEFSAERNSTVVLPMPIDIVKLFLEPVKNAGDALGANGTLRIPRAKDALLSRCVPAVNS